MGDPRPTYRPSFGIPQRYAFALDFALTRAPLLPEFEVQADLRFREQLPLLDGGSNYLSDHCAVELERPGDIRLGTENLHQPFCTIHGSNST